MGADIDGQVQDLISSIELGRRRLGVSSDRVIVWGHSHGALLVERALRQMPLFSGKAILVSYIGDPIFRDRPMQSRARVIAFHGAHDVVRSPASALGELQRIFGERLIDFEALVDEGHSFRRALSWARVYRSALSD
jgi:predicted esterase